MDRHVIARRSQSLGLPDDGIRILVAQQDIGNFRHAGYRMSLVADRYLWPFTVDCLPS